MCFIELFQVVLLAFKFFTYVIIKSEIQCLSDFRQFMSEIRHKFLFNPFFLDLGLQQKNDPAYFMLKASIAANAS